MAREGGGSTYAINLGGLKLGKKQKDKPGGPAVMSPAIWGRTAFRSRVSAQPAPTFSPSPILNFNPLPPIQRGAARARAILQEITPAITLVQQLRALITGKAGGGGGFAYGYPTAYPQAGGPSALGLPPTPTDIGYGQGSTDMYGFLESGADLLGTIGGIAGGVGQVVSAIQNRGQASPTFFDIPGVDIQSPVVSEATVAQRGACEMLMSPFGAPRTQASARPQLFVVPNPTTGRPTFFAPVKITGVRPYNTGIRRRRRCYSGKR